MLSTDENLTYGGFLFPDERDTGISLDSRLAVARLGLGTASRFRLLAQHRSGVRFPLPYNHDTKKPAKAGFLVLERDTGIEPVPKPWEGLVLPLY
jgi:hypothetical protein